MTRMLRRIGLVILGVFSLPLSALLNASFHPGGYGRFYTSAAQDVVATATPAPGLEPVPGKALLPGAPIRIQMTGDGPLDLVYYAAAPGTISVYAHSLDSNAAPVDTLLDVFAPDGSSLATNDDLIPSSGDAGIENLAIPAPGAYRIRLGTFTASETGGVEVQLMIGASPPPGNLTDAGQEVAGQIIGGEPFEFTFRGQAGQIVTITALATNPPSPNLDLALAVYGPDGAQIGYDDDSGPQAGLGDRDAALVALLLPEDGEYRVEVSSYLNISGAFQLRVDGGSQPP